MFSQSITVAVEICGKYIAQDLVRNYVIWLSEQISVTGVISIKQLN